MVLKHHIAIHAIPDDIIIKSRGSRQLILPIIDTGLKIVIKIYNTVPIAHHPKQTNVITFGSNKISNIAFSSIIFHIAIAVHLRYHQHG